MMFRLEGELMFWINDRFEDALDFDSGRPGDQDLPVGRPYSIIARWSERLVWAEKL